MIDEVLITAGVVSNAWRLGEIPSVDNAVHITAVTNANGSVLLRRTSGFGQSYEVQWVVQLSNNW